MQTLFDNLETPVLPTGTHAERCAHLWRSNPHLAFAFVDLAAFTEAAIVSRLDSLTDDDAHLKAFVDSRASASKVAQSRMQQLRHPAWRLSDAPPFERIGNRLAVWVYGPIGDAPCATDADVICPAIEQHADAQAVVLRIASAGGDAGHAFRIAEAIKQHKGRTVAIVDKFALSAATVIAVACDSVAMRSDATWMVHCAVVARHGNADALQEAQNELRRLDISLQNFYANKRRMGWHRARDAMRDAAYLSSIQAQSLGFVDRILPPIPIHWDHFTEAELPA